MKRVRYKFLAGAGGARDQNVGVMTRDFPRHLKYFDHRGASPDDSVKFQIGEQLLFEFANALSAAERIGNFVEGAFEPGLVDRLRQVIVRAVLDGFDRRIEGV